ncbi:acyclic terpene utilization AtuA family protein [Tropicimonas sp. TH_r6]|uniref:acyclic terpene utilization AtuA family protein n=1 Tax=Tropicimonas sp. TH_r6 TaxID=3082085 RepID=UPI002953D6D6|nr:acyclic terpene utilization AtuA family protein [Tropicimonas sp. TH_r6]MDV7143538.1 acyclic terpene utilization AtuA family protein [Tropicimonas sp. TH_r6]
MVKVLIPSGALGLGYDRNALALGIAEKPDIIAIDGGSTDSGPHYLGTGSSKYSRGSVKAEWREIMAARAQAGVPLLIGTAGTCGADDAVDWFVDITREIAAETGETLKLAVLKSGQPAERIKAALAAGKVTPLVAAPEISDETLDSCTNIVALAGAEHIQSALETGADIIIAGRTTDTAIISALPIARGCNPGGAWHGAKIGECGALSTTSPNSGTILIDFDEEGFTMTPMGPEARATPHTVSAHMLYENSDPYVLYEPGGHLDVTGATYTALDDRRVRVTGSKWVPSERYTVKLEGARKAGYQYASLALVRDARYVANVREWCDDILVKATAKAQERAGDGFEIEMRLIGVDATLGALDTGAQVGSEVGVLGIVTADTEAMAREVAKILNPYLLHHPLTEQEEMPTFAFPFSPPEMNRGVVYEFCLNHVLELADPWDAFTLETVEIGA